MRGKRKQNGFQGFLTTMKVKVEKLEQALRDAG
jgi:hypothetical protein